MTPKTSTAQPANRLHLAAAAGCALWVAAAAGAQTPRITLDEETFFGCGRTEGSFVALLKPGLGALVISASEFHGSEAVGVAQDESLAFSVPGTRMPEIQAKSALAYPEKTPISGRLLRNLELPEQALCIGFDRRDFPAASELEPYLQRVIDDVARDLPASSLHEGSFYLSDRPIDLEIAAGGAAPAPLTVEEGTATPLTLPGFGTPAAILALVAPSEEPAVLVKIIGSGDAGSESSPFTRVEGTLVAVEGVDPPIRLRLRAIRDRQTHR